MSDEQVKVTGKIGWVSYFGLAYVQLEDNPGRVRFAFFNAGGVRPVLRSGFLGRAFGMTRKAQAGDRVSGVIESQYAQMPLLDVYDAEKDNRCPPLQKVRVLTP